MAIAHAQQRVPGDVGADAPPRLNLGFMLYFTRKSTIADLKSPKSFVGVLFAIWPEGESSPKNKGVFPESDH
jgi:hypothetical protein